MLNRYDYGEMGNQSKKHHYVPQSLLRGFSINDGGTHVHVFDKRTGRQYESVITNAGSENHFHTVQNGADSLNYEEAFSQADGRLAEVLATLRQDDGLKLLTGQDREDIAALAAMQLFRTKQMRTDYRHMHLQLQDFIKKLYPDAAESVASEIDDNQLKLLTLQLVSNLEESVPALRSKHMIWHQTSREYPFWISDNPVVVHNPSPYGDSGLASPGVEVCWPMSSTLQLSFICPTFVAKVEMTNPANAAVLRAEPTIQSTPENVTFYNSLQGIHASRFVYSRSPNFELMGKMIAKNPALAREQSRMTISGSNAGPSHPRMPEGRWLIVYGRRTQYMIPLLEWDTEVHGPRRVVVSPEGASKLADALADEPTSEIQIYEDRQHRVMSRAVVLVPDPADPLTVTIGHSDPGLDKIMEPRG